MLLRISTGRTRTSDIYHIDTRKGVEISKSHERFKRRRRPVHNSNMQIITFCIQRLDLKLG